MFVRVGEGLRERIVVRDVRLRGREREGGGGMSKVSQRPARGVSRGRATRARRGAAPRRAGRAALDRAPYRLRIESRRLGHREAVVATRHLSRPRRTDPRGRRARGGLAARAERVGAFSPGAERRRPDVSSRDRSRDHPPRARRGLHSPPAIRVAIARRQRGWKPAGARVCARGEEGRGTRFPNPVLAAVGCAIGAASESEQAARSRRQSSVGRISARRVERGNEIDSYTCRGETLNPRVIFCVFACCASRFRGFIGLAGQTRGFDRGLAMNARKNLPIRVSLHREILSEVAWKMTKIAEKTQISEATTRASFA